MADPKRPAPPGPDEPDDEKPKYDAPVKLRREFKEKLEEVAKDLDLYPGELIEQRLGEFARVEYRRVVKRKAEESDAG